MRTWTPIKLVGKTLRVDLDKERIEITDEGAKAYENFLGGKGLNQYFLYNGVKPDVEPFNPSNLLIVGAGLLTGTLIPGATRTNFDTKNVFNGGVGSANVGGDFGPELKFAGFGNVIIKGRAEKPVYLWIKDDSAEIRDAGKIWGKGTSHTTEWIREDLGEEDVQIASIGPAGENLVRGACIMVNGTRAAAKCGVGAVAGSKNLKAIAVKGSKAVEVAEPERFIELAKRAWKKIRFSRTAKIIREGRTFSTLEAKNAICNMPQRNFQDGHMDPEKIKMVNSQAFAKYELSKFACFSCPVWCRAYYRVEEGPYAGTEGEAVEMNSIADFASKLDIPYAPAVIKAHLICNDYGMDIDAAAGAIAWAFEAYEKGAITKEEADGLELKWGAHEVLMSLLKKMAYREGFGDLLAEGSYRASRKIGKGSEEYAITMKRQDLYEEVRVPKGWALGVALSTRGGGHCSGAPLVEREKFPSGVAKKIYGVETTTDPTTYNGKAKLVVFHERFHNVLHSTGICFYTSAWVYPDWLNQEDIAGLVSAATGIEITPEGLLRIGERIHNLERAFNILHVGFGREDDYLPERFFEEPIKSGPYKGEKLDRKKFDEMLDENYRMHGWDERGIPTRETLNNLGLEYVAKDLELAGIIL